MKTFLNFDSMSLNSSYNEKCFRQKLQRKSKYTFYVQCLFSRKSHRLWDNFEKFCADWNYIKICLIRFKCWISKDTCTRARAYTRARARTHTHTHTHTHKYVILFLLYCNSDSRTRLKVTSYVHWLSCFYFPNFVYTRPWVYFYCKLVLMKVSF
jgi:hypothetical protein